MSEKSKNENKAKWGIAAIISIGLLGIGGITLFNFSYQKTSVYEAQRIPDEQEVAAKADIENRQAGLTALEEENYLAALSYFLGIPDDSQTVTDRDQLIDQAVTGYCTQIRLLTDEELDYENFDEAKILLESALQYVSDNTDLYQKLLAEYEYVIFRESLYKVRLDEDTETIISFILEHSAQYGNDKYVADVLRGLTEEYMNDIEKDVHDYIREHDFNGAREILSGAMSLLGENEILLALNESIDESEIEYNINTYEDEEAWNSLIEYAASLPETYQAQYADEVERAEKNLVKDSVTAYKKNEQWRELIDYLNGSTYLEDFQSDYNQAVRNYKNTILESVETLEEQYDFSGVKSLLVSAYDILAGDSSFDELYNRYKDYDPSLFLYCPIVNNVTIPIEDAVDINGGFFENVMKIRHSSDRKVTLEFRLPMNYSEMSGVLFICQENNYKYDETDTGSSKVTFKNDSGQIIKEYTGITYKNPVSFDIPVSGVQFLSVEVERDTYKTVVLGIRDAKMG